MFRQVLVPVKFSTCGLLAARRACDVVRAIGGTVTMLHVLEHPVSEDDGLFQREETRFGAAELLLRQVGVYARRPPTVLIVQALDDVAPAILKVASEMDAKLIMLGMRGQNASGRQTLGSGRVTMEVLLGAGVPVQVTPCHPGPSTLEDSWRSALTER